MLQSIILRKRWAQSETGFTRYQKRRFEEIMKEPERCIDLDRLGNNILHLSVICNEIASLEQALQMTYLKQQRNNLGFTPLELARLLGRKECSLLLDPKPITRRILLEKKGVLYECDEEEFYKRTHVRFVPTLHVINVAVLNWVVDKAKKILSKGDISREQKWDGVFYAEEIERADLPDVTIRWIDECIGYGLFANRSFAEGALIGEYAGLLRKYHAKMDEKNSYCFEYMIGEQYESPFVIDAKQEGNHVRFINHDSDGNLTPKSIFHQGVTRVILIANRKIAKGEQLCYNYGEEYWAQREKPQAIS